MSTCLLIMQTFLYLMCYYFIGLSCNYLTVINKTFTVYIILLKGYIVHMVFKSIFSMYITHAHALMHYCP